MKKNYFSIVLVVIMVAFFSSNVTCFAGGNMKESKKLLSYAWESLAKGEGEEVLTWIYLAKNEAAKEKSKLPAYLPKMERSAHAMLAFYYLQYARECLLEGHATSAINALELVREHAKDAQMKLPKDYEITLVLAHFLAIDEYTAEADEKIRVQDFSGAENCLFLAKSHSEQARAILLEELEK